MPKKKTITKKDKKESSKEDITGFPGGFEVNLDKKTKSGDKLRDVLSKHVGETLDQELKNQEDLIDKLPYWHDQYRGKREPKSFPWQNCANVAIPLTRSNTDAIFVRIIDALFNKVKLWIAKAQKKEFVGFDRELEEQLNWFQKNILQLKKKLFSPLLECIKTGTGLVMIVNEEKHDERMAYATPEELKDPNVKKYSAKGTPSKLVKRIDKTYTGPNIYPIPRSDWVISSDATSIDEAYMCGYRVRLRKPQIDSKVRQDLYDKKEVKKLTAPDKVDEATERRAEAQGKE
ncbi:hypothetical protein LCGC14_2183230, partial [marine sediment metagenome]